MALTADGWTVRRLPEVLSDIVSSMQAEVDANIDASEAKTILDVEAIYDVLDDQITALEQKKLGTIKSTEGILQERSEAIANERTYIQRIKSAKEKAIKKAAKAEAATQTLKENKERLNLEIGGVPTTGGIPWKPAEAQEAMDSTISDNVKKILGQDDLTPSQERNFFDIQSSFEMVLIVQ